VRYCKYLFALMLIAAIQDQTFTNLNGILHSDHNQTNSRLSIDLDNVLNKIIPYMKKIPSIALELPE
jgi:hypothetical protein